MHLFWHQLEVLSETDVIPLVFTSLSTVCEKLSANHLSSDSARLRRLALRSLCPSNRSLHLLYFHFSGVLVTRTLHETSCVVVPVPSCVCLVCGVWVFCLVLGVVLLLFGLFVFFLPNCNVLIIHSLLKPSCTTRWWAPFMGGIFGVTSS